MPSIGLSRLPDAPLPFDPTEPAPKVSLPDLPDAFPTRSGSIPCNPVLGIWGLGEGKLLYNEFWTAVGCVDICVYEFSIPFFQYFGWLRGVCPST